MCTTGARGFCSAGAVRVQGCSAGEPVGMVRWDAGVFEGVTVRCESAFGGWGQISIFCWVVLGTI